jgi:hypothetical protein
MPILRAIRGQGKDSVVSSDDYRSEASSAFLQGRKEVRI